MAESPKVVTLLVLNCPSHSRQDRTTEDSRGRMSEEDVSDSEDEKPFDESQTAMAKTCAGCGRTTKAGDPPLARCSECLTSRFCNRECQKKAWPYHKRACGPMAQIKLNHLLADLTANKQDFCSWFEEVRAHVCAHGTLPDKITEKQLDNLTSLWRCAYAVMPVKQQLDRLKVLTVANLYALRVKRPAHRLEMIIRDTKAVVAALPSAVDEVGSILWGAKHVFWVCLYGGNLMAQSGRAREAVDFAQSVKPNLEVSLLSLAPESNGSSSRGLLTFLKAYAHWLRECSPPGGCVDEFRANPDRIRMVAVLKQIITLGKKLGEDEEVAWCYSRLGTAYLEIEEHDKAVEALQRCLKLPWSEWSAPAACTAVESLVASRKDVQAGKWIEQFLSLASMCPGQVGALEQAALVQWQGVVLARRGRYDEAVDCVRRAEELLKTAATTQSHEHEAIDKLSQELVLDRLDYLECQGNMVEVRKIERRIGAFAALRRPLTFVREIEKRPEVFLETNEVRALEELIKPGTYYDWRRAVKGAGLWAMRLLERLRSLTIQHCPEGEQKDVVLARLEARIAVQEEAERRGAEQMRAQMMQEVRKEVTGKGPGEASKAAKKKRKKRKKKSQAQAREGEEQEEEEEDLEQQMEGLDLHPNGEIKDEAAEEVQQEATARDECVICLNELNEQGEEEEELACGHILHASCLRCWASKCTSLRIEVTCPVCRVAFVQDSSN